MVESVFSSYLNCNVHFVYDNIEIRSGELLMNLLKLFSNSEDDSNWFN